MRFESLNALFFAVVLAMLSGSSASALTCYGVYQAVRSYITPQISIEIKKEWLPELRAARERFLAYVLWKTGETTKNFVGKTFQMHGQTWTITTKTHRTNDSTYYIAESGKESLVIEHMHDVETYTKKIDSDVLTIDGAVFKGNGWGRVEKDSIIVWSIPRIHFPGDTVEYGGRTVQILEVLGWGAQGTVYRVKTPSGESVALKVTHQENKEENSDWVDTLEQFGASHSKAVPKVNRKDIAASHIFMEFIEGIPLDFFLNEVRSEILALPADLRGEIIGELVRTKYRSQGSYQEILDFKTGRIILIDPV